MEKMTKRNVYAALMNYVETGAMEYMTDEGMVAVEKDALRAFAENEIALLDKRAVRAKETAAKKKAENDALTEAVLAAVSDEYESAAEIAVRIEGEDVTAAKVVYRLNKLVADGLIEKTDMKIPATETTKARTCKGFRRMAE